MRRIIYLISLVLLVSNVFAIGYPIHQDSVLSIKISKKSPTRFVIEGEKIKDVFFFPDESAKVILHESGCLFIAPLEASEVYVTIIGEGGTTQDLKVSFVNREPSPVRLIKEVNLIKKENKK